jgi:hypothetical protein
VTCTLMVMANASITEETLSEEITLNMTPQQRQRLKAFANSQGWYETAAIRYFIELGLDTETRRPTLPRSRRTAGHQGVGRCRVAGSRRFSAARSTATERRYQSTGESQPDRLNRGSAPTCWPIRRRELCA